MQTLARNRSGYWELRFSEKLPDGRWRSRSVSTGCKDRGEAVRFREDFLNHGARLAAVGAKANLGQIIDEYLKVKPGQEFVLRSARRSLGHLPVDLLTPGEVRTYREGRVAAGIAGATVRRELGALVAAMNWAAKARFGGVRREDVPHVDKPPPGTPRSAWLDEEMEPRFHALAMGLSARWVRPVKKGRARFHRLTLFVALGLDTAARKEALEGLTWDRVDLVRGKIDFREPGKGGGVKRRTVVEIAARLRPLLEAAREDWVARGAPPLEPVVGVGGIRKAWERWVAGLSGMEWMTPHLMRHSWAKLNARAGVGLFDIAGVLGDRYETVARNYLHDCPVNSGVVDRRFNSAGN